MIRCLYKKLTKIEAKIQNKNIFDFSFVYFNIFVDDKINIIRYLQIISLIMYNGLKIAINYFIFSNFFFLFEIYDSMISISESANAFDYYKPSTIITLLELFLVSQADLGVHSLHC